MTTLLCTPRAVAICSVFVCLPLLHARADVPAAPAAARTLHRFQDLALSPDGTYVASTEGDDLVIRRVKSGAAVTVDLPCAHTIDCSPGSPVWTPDGKHLAFALRTPGSHARSIYTVGADGKGLTKLLAFSGTIIELSYGPDGRLAMLATENARKEVGQAEAGTAITGDDDQPPLEQRIAVLEAGVLHWASPPGLYVYEYDWWPAGHGFIGTASPGDGDSNWYTAKIYAFTAADGAGRVIYSPSSVHQQIGGPRVSRDGRTVAFIGGVMSDFGLNGGDVYTVRLADAMATNITPEMQATARALTWDCKGHLVANLLRGDKTELVELGDGSRSVTPRVLWSAVEGLDRRRGGLSGFNCPSGATVAVHQSFTTPPEIAVGPIGHWRDVTHVNAGLTTPARVQSLTWSSDSFQVQGWLLLPAHFEGKLPLVVQIHGGPAHAWMPTFEASDEFGLLEHGYALFRPNVRGSFGQGERFKAGNIRDFGYGDFRDIQSGVDAVLKAAPIDANRIGITGHSYGGFMTMWAVTQTNRFKAAVSSAGISNWVSYYGTNGITQWMLPYFGKSIYEDPAAYLRSSPINFITQVHTPTLGYVGEFDIEVPPTQMVEFGHALKTLGVPTSLVIYPGEGHKMHDPAHSADQARRTLEWFDKYLR